MEVSKLKWKAKISLIGVNPYVRPPEQVLEAIFQQSSKKTSPIAIKGKLNGASFQQSLVRYQGDWRLYINLVMAKAAKIEFSKSIREIMGRIVTLEVEFDPEPPVYQMLPFLEEALNQNPIAKNNWQKLIPSRQKEILRYFANLKSDQTREKNLKKVLEVLSGKEERFMARSWKNGR